MSRASVLKVVLCGGGGSGKSGLVIRLITDTFHSVYDPTIEEMYCKILSIDNEEIMLDILDTAGQEQFASMSGTWYKDGQIFILVYSITSAKSFSEVKHFAKKIAEAKRFHLEGIHSTNIYNNENQKYYKVKQRPFILVGNKCDLLDDRVVTTAEGKKLAEQWNVPFFECSALNQINLEELWFETARLSRRLITEMNAANETPEMLLQKTSSQLCICCGGGGSGNTGNNNDELSTIEMNDIERQKSAPRTRTVKFFRVTKPIPDEIQPPVLALKNFRLRRKFSLQTFVIALICGLLLPIVIIFQTIAFLLYSETKEAWYFPDEYGYDSVHSAILLDYLGLIVGRMPGQDPQEVRNKKWFLRQTIKQKILRILLCLLIVVAFVLLYYNISQSDNIGVSKMESSGPAMLFWLLWLLLSAWIAFEPEIYPNLPSLSRLRRITLIFGEFFNHRTSVNKFLRAYAAARDDSSLTDLSLKQSMIVFLSAIIYALIPGITRITIGDSSDNVNGKAFYTSNDWMIQVGAFIVNFILVGVFIFAIEVQYAKHFDNYREWMNDLTLLLSKEYNSDEEHQSSERIRKSEEHLEPQKYGRQFGKALFLSLTRRSNALGWLEIRSFLAIEGMLLFGEQELPTLFLMVVTVLLSGFMLFRSFFIDSNPLQSVLFNGCIVLMIICLSSLIRIAVTGYKFQNLQTMQERLLGEQKLWMRCNIAQSAGVGQLNVNVVASVLSADASSITEANSVFDGTRINQQKMKQNKEKEKLKKYNNNDGNNTEMQETDNLIDENGDDGGGGGGQEHKYENDALDIDSDALMSDDENESAPLIEIRQKTVIPVNDNVDMESVLRRVDTSNWYQYNFGFLDDMIYIVRRKDIYPKLFKIKLNNVLAKAIAGIVFTVVITFFKLFFEY